MTLGNPDAYSEVHGKFGNNCLDGIFAGSTRIYITETKRIRFLRKKLRSERVPFFQNMDRKVHCTSIYRKC
mgnify:CR=1 FL=1